MVGFTAPKNQIGFGWKSQVIISVVLFLSESSYMNSHIEQVCDSSQTMAEYSSGRV
jgi:hypothetical protein